MLRFLKHYGYAAWLGLALSVVGHPWNTKEYWLVLLPTFILVSIRPSENFFAEKEDK